MNKEEAIKVLTREKLSLDEKYYKAIDIAIEALKDRQQGEWVYHIDDLFPCESTQECSNCHKHQPININDDDFCPACGADMRGDTD